MNKINKIIVFESQLTHFEIIHEMLSQKGYAVFPALGQDRDQTLKNFKDIIDPVRIYTNPAYSLEIREKAFIKICSFIQHVGPDLIFVEYELNSNDESLTGIDFIIRLQGIIEKIPTLFFTQAPANDINVVKKSGSITFPHRWLAKGYSNDKLFSADFFNDVVNAQIESMIKESHIENAKNKLIKILDGVISKNVLGPKEWEFFARHLYLIEYFSESQLQIISDFHERHYFETKLATTTFFNSLKITMQSKVDIS